MRINLYIILFTLSIIYGQFPIELNKDQSFKYTTPGYETCIVPATGKVNVDIERLQ